MYKLTDGSIQKGNMSIPKDPANRHYQEFIADVKEQGLSIVEGEDVIEPDYVALRQAEYPSVQEQLDMIYHNEANWRAEILRIKTAHPPTITGGKSIAAIPQWVQELTNV